MIIEAYLNFCYYMVDMFDPDYFAYGIEVNMLATSNPEVFEKYLVFLEQVYPQLKSKYPSLPVFLTFQTEYYYQNPETQEPAMERLLPYTDYLALSSYPFMAYPDPATIPDDYFQNRYFAHSLSSSFHVEKTFKNYGIIYYLTALIWRVPIVV